MIIRPKEFSVTVYNGRFTQVIFIGKSFHGYRNHVIPISTEMLETALAEGEKTKAEQVAAIVKERDALKKQVAELTKQEAA